MRTSLAALTSTVMAMLACAKPSPPACDEAALELATASLEAEHTSENSVAEAISTLADACPTIHPGIIFGLRERYADGAADQLAAELANDSSFGLEHRQLCADSEAWSHESATLPEAQRASAMYATCDLGRLGLLDANERFVDQDFYAFLTYDWMQRNGVDATLARRLSRGWMSATASLDILERRCAVDPSGPCERLFARDGLELPTSMVERSLSTTAIEVTISPTAISIGSKDIVPLDEGRLDAGAAPHAVIEVLRAALASDLGGRGPVAAEGAKHVLLVADRRTPHGTVMHVVCAATRAGLGSFELLVVDADGAHAWLFAPPEAWQPELPESGSRERVVEFEADLDGIGLAGGKARLAWTDHAGLTVTGVELRTTKIVEPPNLSVRANAEVPIEVLIHGIDDLRGLDSSSATWSSPRLDLDPPLPRRAVDWDAITLALSPTATKGPAAKGPESEKRLRARIEPALTGIRDCLLESDAARSWAPQKVSLSFAVTQDGKLGVRSFGEFEDEGLESCLAEAVELPLVATTKQFISTYYLDLVVDIAAPELR